MLRPGTGLEGTRRDVSQHGHSAPITTVAWSPDGRVLATGGYDGSVLLWDSEGAVAATFLHPRLVNGVRWSHHGRLLASACADSTCRLWDVESNECVLVLARHTDDVVEAAWSADDRTLVTVAQDGTGRLWSVESGELLDAVLLHRNHCMSVDWDPTSGVIATCGEDSTIRLWDEEGRLLADCPQPGDLESCRFAPSGGVLAGACDSGIVTLLQEDVMRQLGPLPSAAKCVCWSPDGRRLAVGSYDSACTVFDVRSGERVARWQGLRLWPRSIDWSGDGDRIAIGTFDRVPAVVDACSATAAPRRKRRVPIVHVAAGPATHGINAVADAGDAVLLGCDDGFVWLWRPEAVQETPEVVAGMPGGSLVNTVAWEPARELLAFGTFASEVRIQPLGVAAACSDVETRSPVNQVAWSPDGSLLAVATYRGDVHLVEFHGGEAGIIRTIRAHDAAVKGVAWLDGETLVTAATDRLARVLSTRGERLVELVGHGNLLNAVSIAGATGTIATVSRDKTARIWDAASGACVRVLCAHDESVKAVAWRPGSSSLLITGSYDFEARLWNLELDDEDPGFSMALRGHRNGVSAVGWWHGRPLTASWDTTAMIWEKGCTVAAVALPDPGESEEE